MHLFYNENISSESDLVVLNEEETRHCVKTLRLKEGDKVYVTNGKGVVYTCLIHELLKKKCSLEIISSEKITYNNSCKIHIASALTKNISRMEFFIEKAVELGIDSFTPLVCHHSERNNFNRDRFVKISVSAMKQSHSMFLPTINEPVNFKKFIIENTDSDIQKFIAYKDSNALLKDVYIPSKNVIILIGPEGDFSKEEIDFAQNNSFVSVMLGNTRLRTETAALFSCFSIVNSNLSI